MALKRNFRQLDTFSMSSMTDIIFLLLIFFMVTSTLIFPTALEVNLPESNEQISLKPITEIYIDADADLWIVIDRNDSVSANSTPRKVSPEEMLATLRLVQHNDSLRTIALYADSTLRYARVAEVLDIAARNKIRMVLATRSAQK